MFNFPVTALSHSVYAHSLKPEQTCFIFNLFISMRTKARNYIIPQFLFNFTLITLEWNTARKQKQIYLGDSFQRPKTNN